MTEDDEYGPNDRYQMYSREGNDALAVQVDIISDGMREGRVSRRDLPELLGLTCKVVAMDHPEVHDTEPEWAIVDEINKVCDELMWKRIDRDDLFYH